MSVASWMEIGRMDELGRLDTPVHRLDARAKAVVTVIFIGIAMSYPPYALSALTPLLLYPVALLALGRIPPGPILRKVLVASPFALLVGLFNPWLDRVPVAAIGPLTVTGGWLSFGSIVMRFVLTVSAALALVACTGMQRLGAGLGQLGVPRVFVVQLLFLYRYLFVIAAEGMNMWRAVELRSAGPRTLGLRVYGSLLGNLLLRAMDRADRIHRAMVARGFDGEVRVLRPGAMRAEDWLFMAGWVLFFAAARTWNLADVLGRLLLEAGA